ncbi:MAG: DUF488 family protein [archaeon]|nr:DUF488 family protein [archaeon]
MYNRQKLLLQAIGKISQKRPYVRKTYLMKALFLLKQECKSLVGYDFFPYHYGPYSQTVYDDFKALEEQNLFSQKNLSLTKEGKELAGILKMDPEVEIKLDKIIAEFANMGQIKGYVYANYPNYTVRSKELKRQMPTCNGIYSIGYEGKSTDAFINCLVQNNVSLLVDVRRNAFSMKKGFSKSQLARLLNIAGIRYLHMPEFGIESKKRKNLDTAEDYNKLFAEYEGELGGKKNELNGLEELGKNERIALMCFEADKNCCHRGVISDFLKAEVVHI